MIPIVMEDVAFLPPEDRKSINYLMLNTHFIV